MIFFRIELNPTQIAALKAAQTRCDKAGGYELGFHNSHRVLVRDGLLAGTADEPEITEKGRLALRILEIEIDEQSRELRASIERPAAPDPYQRLIEQVRKEFGPAGERVITQASARSQP